MSETRRPAIDRFIDAVQIAVLQHAHHESGLTDAGMQAAIERFRAAIPVAEAIALIGNPLDADATPLERYILQLQTALDREPESPTDPGHESEKAAVANDSTFYVGLAMGLLLAERV